MTSLAKILLISVFCLAITAYVYPQNYKHKITKDSISISYKWQKTEQQKKDSPYMLLLQVENHRNIKVDVSFVVLYYWKAQLNSTSKTKTYSLKPRQIIRWKRWNLAFNPDFIVMDKYLDPMFTWEIDRLKVTESID